MPSGIYIRTKEYRDIMSKITKGKTNPFFGKKHSLESLEKMRLAKLGKKQSKETRQKRSNSMMGKLKGIATRGVGWHHTKETKQKISKINKGMKFTEETRRKMSIARKGKYIGDKNPFYGKRHSKKTKEKNGKAHSGDRNWNWKGGISKQKGYKNFKRRKLNITGFHTIADWNILKAQYNWTCPACRKSEPEIKLTEDHIIPVSRGGSNNIENIQPLCQSCNSKKHTKIIKYNYGD